VPVQVDAVDAGYTITLIGVYAETGETVVIFRMTPGSVEPAVQIGDSAGPIGTGGSSYKRTPIGDYVYSLDGGPHPGPDGTASVSIAVISLTTDPGPTGPAPKTIAGHWTWSVAVPVQASVSLSVPNAFGLGSWTLDGVSLQESATQLRLQAVIHGVSPGNLQPTSVQLLSFGGAEVASLGFSAAIIVSKQQLNPSNYQNSQVIARWAIPVDGSYVLRFTNGSTVQDFPITIHAIG
jgi:hypothetical protein